MKSKFKIDTTVEKYEAKLQEIYNQPSRTPEWYYEAGKRFRSTLEVCQENKWKESIETIEETFERHWNNLNRLNLNDHANLLSKGYQGE